MPSKGKATGSKLKVPAVQSDQSKSDQSKMPHPKYSQMITAALLALKDRKGSSQYAIAKHIGSTYEVPAVTYKKAMSRQIKVLEKSGEIVRMQGKFKVAAAPPKGIGAGAPKSKTSDGSLSKPKTGENVSPHSTKIKVLEAVIKKYESKISIALKTLTDATKLPDVSKQDASEAQIVKELQAKTKKLKSQMSVSAKSLKISA